jgi:tetratricopeptide (TPR) repeat protein
LPISARADTFFYRATKFARRHQWSLSASGLVLLSLVIGMITTLHQTRRAEQERAIAENRAENLRQISKSLVFDIHDAIRNLPGSLPARKILLERAVEQLNVLSQDAENNPNLQEELARAYFNVGEMQQAFGDVAAAEESHERALKIYEKLAFENPQITEYRRGLAIGFQFLANIAYMRGEIIKSTQLYAEAPPILERLAAENSNDEKLLENLWNAYQDYAVSLNRSGKSNEALAINQRALEIAERLNQAENPDADRLQMLYLSEGSIGVTYYFTGNYQEAIKRLEKVISKFSNLQQKFPEDTRFRYDLWAFNRRLGIAYDKSGRVFEAQQTLENSLGYIENLMKSSPKDAGYKRNTSITLLALAQSSLNQQNSKKALTYLLHAQELSESLLKNDRNNGETISDLALIYGSLSTTLAQAAKFEESLSLQEKSLEYLKYSKDKNSENFLMKRDYSETLERTAAAFTLLAKKQNTKKAKDFEAKAKLLLRESQKLWN